MTDVDGNKYAIDQHLYSLEDTDYAQYIMDQMSDKDLMEYAEDWDIYIKDDSGKWVDDGLEALYEKIEQNLDTFAETFCGE
jgi:hypothetical protein